MTLNERFKNWRASQSWISHLPELPALPGLGSAALSYLPSLPKVGRTPTNAFLAVTAVLLWVSVYVVYIR